VPVTDLAFTVLDARPEPHAAAPALLFRVRATEASGETVHAIALRAQVHIEPQRRRYAGSEADQLTDLFGTADRWSTTLRPFLWTHTSAMVRGFTGSVEFDLPMPCTYDFEVAGSKYLHSLADGEVPLVLRFAGTVFTRGSTGFGVQQVPWNLEAAYRLPVRVWRDAMDTWFPGAGWIRLDRDTLDALVRYRAARGLTSWEQVLGGLLAEASEVTP
jgi:Family of unknown function (DUF6084)